MNLREGNQRILYVHASPAYFTPSSILLHATHKKIEETRVRARAWCGGSRCSRVKEWKEAEINRAHALTRGLILGVSYGFETQRVLTPV